MTDEELYEIANYFINKDTCMHANYCKIDLKEMIKEDPQKVIDDIQDEFQYLLGICGCGRTDEVYKGIYAFLTIVQNKTNDPMNSEKHDLVWNWVFDDWENEFIANTLDDKGLIDHGTMIGGCFITDLGKWFLKIFTEYFMEQHIKTDKYIFYKEAKKKNWR